MTMAGYGIRALHADVLDQMATDEGITLEGTGKAVAAYALRWRMNPEHVAQALCGSMNYTGLRRTLVIRSAVLVHTMWKAGAAA